MTHDYSEYLDDDGIGDNAMGQLRHLANAQKEAELEVERLRAELKQAESDLRDISERQIPEMLDELGLDTFQTKDGLSIRVKETIRASMGRSDEEKGRALDWLEDNGHGALIKRVVEVPFGRGQDEAALGLRNQLRADGNQASFSRRVEPSTLRAFVTEKLTNGEEIPLEIFKVQRARKSVIEV